MHGGRAERWVRDAGLAHCWSTMHSYTPLDSARGVHPRAQMRPRQLVADGLEAELNPRRPDDDAEPLAHLQSVRYSYRVRHDER